MSDDDVKQQQELDIEPDNVKHPEKEEEIIETLSFGEGLIKKMSIAYDPWTESALCSLDQVVTPLLCRAVVELLMDIKDTVDKNRYNSIVDRVHRMLDLDDTREQVLRMATEFTEHCKRIEKDGQPLVYFS
jgi:hypothetical protein